MVKKNCLFCNKEFTTKPSQIKQGRGKYCSKKCNNESQKRRIEKTCLVCGKIFYRRPSYSGPGNFCSNECKHKARITGQKRNCLVCGKEFFTVPCQINEGKGRFCSKKCVGMSQRKELCSYGYKMTTNKSGKRDKEHRVIAEKALSRPLKRGETVHHIDLIKSNNSSSNLLICTNSYHHYLHHRMAERYAELFLRKANG